MTPLPASTHRRAATGTATARGRSAAKRPVAKRRQAAEGPPAVEGPPITAQDRELIAAASEVLRRCYRRGRHTVGAAVRCPSGRIYTGVNVEACGYGPCAEPIAIGAAFSQGEGAISAIVAVKKQGGKIVVLSPCGNCRQLVFDYSPDAVVLYSLNGGLHKATAAELLPGAYRSHFDGE
jgi:cytidine deaminase